jgi:hypothetical protein
MTIGSSPANLGRGVVIFVVLIGLVTVGTAVGVLRAAGPGGQPQERARMAADHLELSDKPVTTKLAPKPTEKGIQSRPVSDLVKNLALDRKLYLVVRDFQTKTQPGVTYSIYVDLPSDASPEVAAKHLAGTVNFFNANVAQDSGRSVKSDRSRRFDITSILKSLSSAGTLGNDLTVTAVPNGIPDQGAKPRIGELMLIEQ